MKDRMKNLCARKQHSVYIFLFLLCLAGFTAEVSAQYSVKNSDTLWAIAEKNTQPKLAWETIYEKNQFLHEAGRRSVTEDGRTIIVIHEGEILQGVDENGLVPAPTPTITPTPSPSPSPKQDPGGQNPSGVEIPWWFWWLLVIIAAIAGVVLIGRWLYNRNGTTWRPRVPGGVNDQTAEQRFNRYAQRRRAIVISGSVRKVRLYGVWLTDHRNFIPIPHRYDGARAYAARFRMENGMEREGIMLQGCGNDVSSGAWYTALPGARIEEGWGDENSQTSTTTPTPAAEVVPEPVDTKVEPKDEIIEDDESNVFSLKVRRPTEDRPEGFVEILGLDPKSDNADLSVDRSGKVKLTLRFNPNPDSEE